MARSFGLKADYLYSLYPHDTFCNDWDGILLRQEAGGSSGVQADRPVIQHGCEHLEILKKAIRPE
jgi:hypothetical protein